MSLKTEEQRRSITLGLFLTLILFTSHAQVSIDLPINKAVFQRNSSNNATITIAGAYTSKVISSIQARLVTPGTSTPVPGFDWTIIDQSPSKGQYQGNLNNVPAGWYTLQVRSVKSGVSISSSQVSRVGVGDVFLAFGQSNAQGFLGVTSPSISSEKVISHQNYTPCINVVPPYPSLSSMNSGTKIALSGESAWYYGKLGDLLVSSNGVPVSFFNAAATGASVDNFIESFSGSDSTIHYYTGKAFCSSANPSTALGAPSYPLKRALHLYHSLFGIRGIYWHQGETDNAKGTTANAYKNSLNQLITLTRNELGSQIPWIISRASFLPGDSISTNVINGQNQVINPANQIFNGPFTDDVINSNPSYPNSRVAMDNLHFENAGLVEVGNRISNILTSNIYNGNTQSFFNASIPIVAKAVPAITYSISGSNVTLTAPGGYTSYKWVSGNNYEGSALSTSTTYSNSAGIVSCYVSDIYGNLIKSKSVNIGAILLQQSMPSTCTTPVYLSDYAPYSISNGFGPIGIDKSNGAQADGDGSVLTLDGVTYTKGLGVHSNSELVYKLPAGNIFKGFTSIIGLDDSETGGSVIFKVYTDNNLVYTSPVINSADDKRPIYVSLLDKSELKLVVEDAGDGNAYDHADWANAKLLCEIPVPDSPSNFALEQAKSKCLDVIWDAVEDEYGIDHYKVYQEGNLVGTTSDTTFTVGGLSRNSSYTIGVKAVNAFGGESATVSINEQTTFILIKYNDGFTICTNDSVSPSLIVPIGAIFSISSGGAIAGINSQTGVIHFSEPGTAQIKMEIGTGTSCEDLIFIPVTSYQKPTTPVISATPDLLNLGDSSVISSGTGCGSYTYTWSNDSTNASFVVSPTDTVSYYLRCNNSGQCYSDTSNIIQVKVIPDCPESFQLQSTASDLNYGGESFDFFAEEQIEATNKLYSPTGAIFKAGDHIQLKPGFEVQAGSVFSATIEGCP